MANQQSFLKQNQINTTFNAYRLNRSRLAVLPGIVWSFVVVIALLSGLIFINNFIPVRVLSSFLPFIEPRENNLSPKELILNQQSLLQEQQFLAQSQNFDSVETGQFLVGKTCIAELSQSFPNTITEVSSSPSQWLIPVNCNDDLKAIQLIGIDQDSQDLGDNIVNLNKSKAVVYGELEGINNIELDRAWEVYLSDLLQAKSSDVIRLGQVQFLLSEGCNQQSDSCQLWQLDQFGLQTKLLNQDLSEIRQDGAGIFVNYPTLKFSPLQDSYPSAINLSAVSSVSESLILIKVDANTGQITGTIPINKIQDETNYQRFLPL